MSHDTMKRCCHCKQHFPSTPEFFNKNRSAPDGLSYECRQCRKKRRNNGGKTPTPIIYNSEGLRRCTICLNWFPPTNEYFRKQAAIKDGLNPRCKTCSAIENKQYSGTERGKQAKRRHYLSSQGKVKTNIRNKRYSKTAKGKIKACEAALRARTHYPLKYKARKEVYKATKRGEIPPATELLCAKCGQSAHHYHHYLGYKQEHWFDIIPLCRTCHIQEHTK